MQRLIEYLRYLLSFILPFLRKSKVEESAVYTPTYYENSKGINKEVLNESKEDRSPI